MRRFLLLLASVAVLGPLAGCQVVTGKCDCDGVPPPVVHPGPPPLAVTPGQVSAPAAEMPIQIVPTSASTTMPE